MRKLKTALLASAVSAGMCGAAAAQDTISFGDSLSDAGNVFALTGGLIPGGGGAVNPAGALSPAGLFGPFSTRFVTPGGLTAVEQFLGGTPIPSDGIIATQADFPRNATSPQSVFFSELTATGTAPVTGDVNLAVGGAFAGTGNLGNGSAPGTAGLLPGVQGQINAFAAAGGTISAEDTITYWAGANNFFFGLGAAGAAADPIAAATQLALDTATAALGDITNIATGATIAGGGPGTAIVINLPNLGATPGIAAGGADASALGSFATTVFNDGLEQGVQALAATDTNTDFVFADVATIFDAIIADPAAFGFTDVTTPCLAVAACANDADVQATFLFADFVHPTNAGYALIAQLLTQLVNPEIGGSQTIGVGDSVAAGRQSVAGQALNRARTFFFTDNGDEVASTNGAEGRKEAFVEALAETSTIGARGAAGQVDTTLFGTRFGSDVYASERFVAGVQGSIVNGDGAQPSVSFNSESYAFDIYGAARFKNGFAALSFGAATFSLEEIERSTGIGPLINEGVTSGSQFNIIGEVGYTYKTRGYTVLPSLQLGFFHTDIQGYTESGIVAPLTFGDRSINAVTGAANVRVARDFGASDGINGRLVAGVGYEDFLSYRADDLTVGAVDSTAAATAVTVDTPDGRGFVFDLGARVNITKLLAVDAEYALGIGGNNTESHRGSVRLTAKF